jgi:hypothetical protein
MKPNPRVYAGSLLHCTSSTQPLTEMSIVEPANPNSCITLRVGNLADEKFYAFNEVARMKFLGTVVHRLTELLPNHCQHRGNLHHNYIFK